MRAADHRSRWLLAGVFLVTLPLVNPYIRGDGNGYYAYVRSAVIDGDLRFDNEFRRANPAFVASAFGPDGRVSPSLALDGGYVLNQWAVGPSILWTPAFLLGHGTALGLSRLGFDVPPDGYSPPYRWLCALATAGYAFLGLALACRSAAEFVGSRPAVAGTIGVWLASPLPVYMYFLPFHVHALSAFAVSLFVWYWLRTRRERAARHWALWGLAGGLMVEVYYLNAICLLIAALELGREALAAPRRGGAWAIGHGGAFALGAFIALLPHGIVKWIVHGSPLATGYEDRFFWGSPRLWQVAFASEHGMFLWTPVLLAGLAGLGVLWRRDRWAGGSLALVWVTYYYAVASYENWHGQSAFGNRFFVSLTPLFVLGLAALLAAVWELPVVAGRGALASFLVLGPLIVWNAGLMFQWGTGLMPNRGPVDWGVVARDQVTRVPRQAVAFLGRYLTDRGQVSREVERSDDQRARAYHPRR